MSSQIKRVVLLATIATAGAALLITVLSRPSGLPSVDPSAPSASTSASATAAAPQSTDGDTATGQPPAFIVDLQQRLAANPRDRDALSTYGDMLMQIKRYPQAADAYATLVDVDPQNASGHMRLGAALFYQGITGMAQLELKRAIELDPNDVQAQYNYALAMSHGPKADPDAAAASWRRVVQLDPNGELGQQAQRMLDSTGQ
jgi:cytochrome c-type biogenesis protein CcmH/NrfG